MQLISILLSLLLTYYSVQALEVDLLLYQRSGSFHSPNPTVLDGFGFAVASEGNQILIGAPHTAVKQGQSGKGYLFDKQTGKLVHTFSPSFPAGDDLFGLSVQLTPDFVMIGSPRGRDEYRLPTGVVYQFDRMTGKFLKILRSPRPHAGSFGHVIDMKDSLMLVGDPGASNKNAFHVGAAYLFDTTTEKVFFTFLSPDPRQGRPDGFGQVVNFFGSKIAISAPFGGSDPIDSGIVYLFEAESGKFLHSLRSPDPQSNEYFGWALASDEDFLVIGAQGHTENHREVGAAYVFDRNGRFLQKLSAPNREHGNHFGEAVALHDDYIIIAAPGDDTAGIDTGSVFIFDKAKIKFKFVITNPSPTTGVADLFGVSISKSGEDLLIGSPYGDMLNMPDSGVVHRFRFH